MRLYCGSLAKSRKDQCGEGVAAAVVPSGRRLREPGDEAVVQGGRQPGLSRATRSGQDDMPPGNAEIRAGDDPGGRARLQHHQERRVRMSRLGYSDKNNGRFTAPAAVQGGPAPPVAQASRAPTAVQGRTAPAANQARTAPAAVQGGTMPPPVQSNQPPPSGQQCRTPMDFRMWLPLCP